MDRPHVVSSRADPIPAPVSPRVRWAILGSILLTMFLASLDQTVVGTALPRIVTDLNGNSLYTWVVTSYLLASTITVPVYGKFSDVYGRKPMLLIGVSIFLFGSLLSGLSQSMEQLVLFRGVQGLGAGAIFPISLAVIGDLFSARERGRYQGLFGAVFGLSFLIGPFIGGWITDNISWHWVFFVNLPVGIAALVVMVLVLPRRRAPSASARDLDYVGIALFTAGVIPLLLGLTNKGTVDSSGQLYPWTDPRVGGLILAGLAVLLVFAFAETRAKEPIIPLDLFRGRDYTVSMIAVFLFGLAMFTAIIFMPRYFQVVRGISATRSGYYVWPLLVGLMGGSILSGQIISRIGRYKWILVGATVLLMTGSVLMTRLTAGIGDWPLWGAMLVFGLGLGPPMAGFTVVIQNAVPLARLGVATSTMTFFRQIGGSVGLAVADTVFASAFAAQLPKSLAAQGVPQQIIDAIGRQGQALTGVGDLAGVLTHVLPAPLHALIPRIVAGVHDAFSLSVAGLFWISFLAGSASFVCTLVLRDRRLRGAGERQRELLAVAEAPAEGSPAAAPSMSKSID